MTPKLIDVHAHLNFSDFDADRERVISNTLNAGIWFINVGTDLETSKQSVDLASRHGGVFASVGLHPHYIDQEFHKTQFEQLVRDHNVVAIGECGLDYSKVGGGDEWNRERQKKVFKSQIELALETSKPLIVHCRDAHADMLDVFKYYLQPERSIDPFKRSQKNLSANIHFFSGTPAEAREYLNLGFMLSFAGPITFTTQYDEIIKETPLDRIMVETDSPFAAPGIHRGKRCEPFYVEEVAKKIAEIRGMSFEEVAEATTANAVNFFRLN